MATFRKRKNKQRKHGIESLPPADQLEIQIRASELPLPETEYKFHPERKWRFDYAYPNLRLGIEVHGGVFISGRHTSPLGFINDREKMNAAQELGWTVLEFTPAMISSGEAIEQLKRTHWKLTIAKVSLGG